MECQHFLDAIRHGRKPLTDGTDGRELIRVLEAASASLRHGGARINVHANADPLIANSQPACETAGAAEDVPDELEATPA